MTCLEFLEKKNIPWIINEILVTWCLTSTDKFGETRFFFRKKSSTKLFHVRVSFSSSERNQGFILEKILEWERVSEWESEREREREREWKRSSVAEEAADGNDKLPGERKFHRCWDGSSCLSAGKCLGRILVTITAYYFNVVTRVLIFPMKLPTQLHPLHPREGIRKNFYLFKKMIRIVIIIIIIIIIILKFRANKFYTTASEELVINSW